MSHHKLEIVIKIRKSSYQIQNCINHLNHGLITFLKDLKRGYNKIDFKDHALFKVNDKLILIRKFLEPIGNQINNDINLLIINSNVILWN